jgi:hypothetical protein
MVFGESATNQMNVFGNIGSQTGLPVMKFHSDSGPLSLTIDISNGFATIKPGNGISFNGLDITIPGDAANPLGYAFTQLVFDEQLTPSASPTDNFTLQGFTGSHVAVGVIGSESDAADTDKQFSITAVNGTFDEVNILSGTGFDEIKHLEVGGVCAIQANGTCTPTVISTPEPSSFLLLGFGTCAMGLMWGRKNGRKLGGR